MLKNKSTKNVDTEIKTAEKLPQYRQPVIEYPSSDEGSDAEAIPAYAVVRRYQKTLTQLKNM